MLNTGIRRPSVLVLDSEPEFLIALEHVLEEEGFSTTTTWDAREATVLLASLHFDVVLVGEHPPEVRSAELLRQLEGQQKTIPCIVVQSAARYPFEAQYLCALGVYAVISRWKHKAIVEQIRQSLRRSCSAANHAMAGWRQPNAD